MLGQVRGEILYLSGLQLWVNRNEENAFGHGVGDEALLLGAINGSVQNFRRQNI